MNFGQFHFVPGNSSKDVRAGVHKKNEIWFIDT